MLLAVGFGLVCTFTTFLMAEVCHTTKGRQGYMLCTHVEATLLHVHAVAVRAQDRVVRVFHEADTDRRGFLLPRELPL